MARWQVTPSRALGINAATGVKALGYASIIDLQENPLPALGQSLMQAGLEYRTLPMTDMTCRHIDAFIALLEVLPHPVLVCCTRGNRAMRLYQAALLQQGA